MTPADLGAARAALAETLGEARPITEARMARLLGVSINTLKSWGTRGRVPPYIAASVAAHRALTPAALRARLT